MKRARMYSVAVGVFFACVAVPAVSAPVDEWDPEGGRGSWFGSNSVALQAASDSAPDNDFATAFPEVTLVGQASPRAVVSVGQARLGSTADSTGRWEIVHLPLNPGANHVVVHWGEGGGRVERHIEIERVAVPAGAEAVIGWNATAIDLTRTRRLFPTEGSRALAMVHAAMFDAANSIDPRCAPYLGVVAAPGGADMTAAVSEAARATLVALFPLDQAEVDAFHTLVIGAIAEGPARDRGIEVGRAAAAQLLAARKEDGSKPGTAAYRPRNGPGRWRPTRPAFRPSVTPHWVGVRPFAIESATQFRLPAPPPIGSPEYANAVEEVRRVGCFDSAERTADQTLLARYWSDGLSTGMPPGHWNRIAALMARNKKIDLYTTTRMYAMLNFALADSAIACWEGKYHYDLWRPVTAIHLADKDGNDATVPDELWEPLITTPPFPEYPSGHSTFSGAAAEILVYFFGEDVPFDCPSEYLPETYSIPNVSRHFASVREAAKEASVSRVYGGIHYRFSCEAGLEQGKAIAQHVLAHCLLEKGRPAR